MSVSIINEAPLINIKVTSEEYTGHLDRQRNWEALRGLLNGVTAVADIVFNEDVAIAGDFSATGRLLVMQVSGGKWVTLYVPAMTHASADNSASDTFIPSDYRPSGNGVQNVYRFTGAQINKVTVGPSGLINFEYVDWAGAGRADTTTGMPFSITWYIDD